MSKLSPEQKKLIKKIEKLHKVYRRFCKDIGFTGGNAEKLDYDKVVKFGYKYADKYPDRVFVVRCDDNVHASALLVIIAHESEDKYMGASVLYCSQPQCAGESAKFFLYPNHVAQMLPVLRQLNQKAKPKRCLDE